MQWGLAQTHCVTVPLKVILFSMSYAALPWCANSGRETIKAPIPRARTIKNLPFKSHLLFGGTRPASLGWVRPHLSELDAILMAASAANATGFLKTVLSKARQSIVLPRTFSQMRASDKTLTFIRWDEKAGLQRDAIRSQCSTCSRHKEKETGYEKD